MLNIFKDIALPVKKCPPGTEPDPGKQWWSRSRPESKWLWNPMMNQCCRLALDSCPKIIWRRLLLLISSSAINLSHLFYLKTLKFRHKQLEPEVSRWKGQFSSRHFIMAENIYAIQSEAKFRSLLLKFCQNVSQGNQSIHFTKGKIKAAWVILYFPC